jgi:RNA polymerase sigma-70 factor (sigma-E family)
MDHRDADFSAYLDARQQRLLRIAYLLTGDPHEAQDLLQTSLAKLYLSWERVRDRENLDAYVRRIMVNENNSLWRRAWRRREVATDEVPDRNPVHDSYDEGDGALVWALVQSLPRKARAVVVLRYYEQLSEAETAEVLGISPGAPLLRATTALT